MMNEEKKEPQVEDGPTVEFDFELNLSKDKKHECRSIVRTINEFGVSQRQKLYLIYLLSLELESNEIMRFLVDATKKARKMFVGEKTTAQTLELPNKPKLIIGDSQKPSKLL